MSFVHPTTYTKPHSRLEGGVPSIHDQPQGGLELSRSAPVHTNTAMLASRDAEESKSAPTPPRHVCEGPSSDTQQYRAGTGTKAAT